MSRLGERTWTDLSAATGTDIDRSSADRSSADRSSADRTPIQAPPIVALPIGSCEQHGPHLPLDTDTRIAVALADRLATAVDGVVVAPPFAVTASGEHRGFPGTLSIGTDATTLVLIELVRSADWSRGVVFVNGHGGNASAVRAAVRTLTAEGRHVVAWWPRIADGDAHAGRAETSLMLAVAPHLVRLDAAESGNTGSLAELSAALTTGGVAAVSPNGVLGDPSGASAAEGGVLLDELAADLVMHVRATWP